MSDLLWESRSDKCGVRLCCAQLCMLVENSGFTSSRPHKCGDHITHQMCSSTFDARNSAVRERVQEKASVLSGRQTHQGKSQRPCSWDSREERNRISDAYRQSHLQDGEQAIALAP